MTNSASKVIDAVIADPENDWEEKLARALKIAMDALDNCDYESCGKIVLKCTNCKTVAEIENIFKENK